MANTKQCYIVVTYHNSRGIDYVYFNWTNDPSKIQHSQKLFYPGHVKYLIGSYRPNEDTGIHVFQLPFDVQDHVWVHIEPEGLEGMKIDEYLSCLKGIGDTLDEDFSFSDHPPSIHLTEWLKIAPL